MIKQSDCIQSSDTNYVSLCEKKQFIVLTVTFIIVIKVLQNVVIKL